MGKPGAHWTPPPPQTKAQKAKQYAANVKQAKANSAKAAKNRKWVASHGGQFTKAAGPSSTTRILGYFPKALPASNETCCMLNHQRRLTLPRPTAAPTATQLRVF